MVNGIAAFLNYGAFQRNNSQTSSNLNFNFNSGNCGFNQQNNMWDSINTLDSMVPQTNPFNDLLSSIANLLGLGGSNSGSGSNCMSNTGFNVAQATSGNYNFLEGFAIGNLAQSASGVGNTINGGGWNVAQAVSGIGNKAEANGMNVSQSASGVGNTLISNGLFGSEQNLFGMNNKAVTFTDGAKQTANGFNNTLISEGNNATQIARGGNNTLISEGDNATQIARGGDNTLVANGKDNVQITGAGNDNITTGGGKVDAGAGNDVVNVLGDAGDTDVNLGAGDDILNINMTDKNGSVKVNGGEGNDRVNITDNTITDTNWNVDWTSKDEDSAFTIKVGEKSYIIGNDIEALELKNANGEVILNIDNIEEWKAQQLAQEQAA